MTPLLITPEAPGSSSRPTKQGGKEPVHVHICAWLRRKHTCVYTRVHKYRGITDRFTDMGTHMRGYVRNIPFLRVCLHSCGHAQNPFSLSTPAGGRLEPKCPQARFNSKLRPPGGGGIPLSSPVGSPSEARDGDGSVVTAFENKDSRDTIEHKLGTGLALVSHLCDRESQASLRWVGREP